jgi:hypothetical protein
MFLAILFTHPWSVLNSIYCVSLLLNIASYHYSSNIHGAQTRPELVCFKETVELPIARSSNSAHAFVPSSGRNAFVQPPCQEVACTSWPAAFVSDFNARIALLWPPKCKTRV